MEQLIEKGTDNSDSICRLYKNQHNIIAGCKQVENLEKELTQKDQLNQELEKKLQQLNSVQDTVLGFRKHAEALETEVGVFMKKVQENNGPYS